MSAKKSSVKNGKRNGVRTWIELDSAACRRNIETFKKLIGPKIKLWAVVKSNAYGHGLPAFPKLVEKFGVDPVRGRTPRGARSTRLLARAASNGVDGFCVDSIIEGLRLRKEGIKKPILVLGFTLPQRFGEAAAKGITITISNLESLKALKRAKRKPFYHLKIDTGMHRQGFYIDDIPNVIKQIANRKSQINKRYTLSNSLQGIYSHFASAKNPGNTLKSAYTEKQFNEFKKAIFILESAGFTGLTKHIAATAGTLTSPEYRLDAVRVGIGLYGLWPSEELEKKFSRKMKLTPVLSWRAIISEIKTAKPGGYIGYDLTEKIKRPIKYALLPVGYWHGISRSLSRKGEVLINGKRARILGRVSMDMVVVDVSGITCKPGDIATIIGRSGKEEIRAADIAELSGTSHYEFLTRLNPLMEKVII